MLKSMLPALCAAALWLLSASTASAQATTSNVAGSVNGKPITWTQLLDSLRTNSPSDFNQAVAQAVGPQVATGLFGPKSKPQMTITRAQALAALRKNPPPQVANEMGFLLRDEALRQEAAKAGIKVTNAEVDARLSRVLKNLRAQRGVDPSITDDQFLASLPGNITRARAQMQIRSQVTAFRLMQKDYEKTIGHPIGPNDYLKPRHILLMVQPATPETKPEDTKKAEEEIKAKIEKIREEIVSGKKSFEDAAKEYSEDGSKEQGGNLGVYVRGALVKEFENAAYALKPGEISQPVRTQFGYHLIQVEKASADLSPEEREQALDGLLQARYPQFLQELLGSRMKIVNNVQQVPPPGAIRPPVGMRPGARPALPSRTPVVRPPAPMPEAPKPEPPAPKDAPGSEQPKQP